MKPLPIKKIIIKAFSLPIKDFNNFINIIIVPYVIILPFYLYTVYYDDFVLNLFETEGFLAYGMGSLRSNIVHYVLILPFTSCLFASWHRYVFFDGDKPWTYRPLDFSKYTLKFYWKVIIVSLVVIVPAIITGFAVGYFGLVNNPFVITTLVVLYIVLLLIYFVRVSVIFPATAVEKNNTFKKIFQLTKNNFWRMFLIYISSFFILLFYFIIAGVFEFFLPTEGNLIRLMLMGVIDTIFMFFLYIYLASCASLIYKHLIKQ